eukprot:6469829-Amphidinium_carterae.1
MAECGQTLLRRSEQQASKALPSSVPALPLCTSKSFRITNFESWALQVPRRSVCVCGLGLSKSPGEQNKCAVTAVLEAYNDLTHAACAQKLVSIGVVKR